MRKFLYNILLIVNILLAAGLILSYLSTNISPLHLWPLAFFGLFYPYLLLANILFILWWLIKWKKAVFISLIVVLAGFNYFNHFLPIFRSKGEKKNIVNSTEIKIISYNVRAFNIYEWLNDPNTNQGIFNFIRSEHPDIICIQEYYTSKESQYHPDNIKRLFAETPYQHIHYTIQSGDNTGYGIATFSKYPIIRKGVIPFDETSNATIFTDVVVNTDTIRIYNNHLQSVHFKPNNYNFIDSLQIRYNQKQIRELQDSSYKLKNAYQKRAAQADKVADHMKTSPYPLIVCGDFNDPPVSYTYHKISSGLEDAFVRSGRGSGQTYPGKLSFRIDYILYSKEFHVIEFEKVESKLSDHYPVMAIIGIRKE